MSQQFGNEFRVRETFSAKRLANDGIVIGGSLVAILCGGTAVLQHDAKGNLGLVILFAVLAGCAAAAAIRRVWRAKSGATIVLATPEGLDLGRTLREPWSAIGAVSLHVQTVTDSNRGVNAPPSWSQLLTVERVDATAKPAKLKCPDGDDGAWDDLFDYIRTVAPHVRLTDNRATDRAEHEQKAARYQAEMAHWLEHGGNRPTLQ